MSKNDHAKRNFLFFSIIYLLTGSININIATLFSVETRRLRILLAITLVVFIAGLVTPIITMTKFLLLENTFSVLSGALGLLQEQQYFLFMVITGFSVVLPLLKMGVLYKLLSARQQSGVHLDRYLHWMHLFGKWSMLDVFVVAILVVAVKLGAIASVEMRFGLYAFTAAVVLTMYITARVVSLMDNLPATQQEIHISKQ
ncbi:paraquat-inducible protein A [Neptunomonas japonica]|nr:paraquat-inducible protein A [Neptunomonas japonica]